MLTSPCAPPSKPFRKAIETTLTANRRQDDHRFRMWPATIGASSDGYIPNVNGTECPRRRRLARHWTRPERRVGSILAGVRYRRNGVHDLRCRDRDRALGVASAISDARPVAWSV